MLNCLNLKNTFFMSEIAINLTSKDELKLKKWTTDEDWNHRYMINDPRNIPSTFHVLLFYVQSTIKQEMVHSLSPPTRKFSVSTSGRSWRIAWQWVTGRLPVACFLGLMQFQNCPRRYIGSWDSLTLVFHFCWPHIGLAYQCR